MKQLQEATLRRTRMIVTAMAVGVLVLTAISGRMSTLGGPPILIVPLALIGVVSPVIGYRVYLYKREHLTPESSEQERCRAFEMACILAPAVTEAAALFGVVGFILTGHPFCLAGVAMHILLIGAIWPTPEKLAAFLDN